MLHQTSDKSRKLSFRSKISSNGDKKEKITEGIQNLTRLLKKYNLKHVNETRCRNELN